MKQHLASGSLDVSKCLQVSQEIRKAIYKILKSFCMEKQYIIEEHEKFNQRAVGLASYD